jgi:hypothetical protein
MTKFTKGPWEYDGHLFIMDKENDIIAILEGAGSGLPTEPNGRLISAAPTAYEILKKVMWKQQRNKYGISYRACIECGCPRGTVHAEDCSIDAYFATVEAKDRAKDD